MIRLELINHLRRIFCYMSFSFAIFVPANNNVGVSCSALTVAGSDGYLALLFKYTVKN